MVAHTGFLTHARLLHVPAATAMSAPEPVESEEDDQAEAAEPDDLA